LTLASSLIGRREAFEIPNGALICFEEGMTYLTMAL